MPRKSHTPPQHHHADPIATSAGFIEVGSVRPDPRGRLTLAKSKEVSEQSFNVDAYKQFVNEYGEILLVPVVEIPHRELWLHQNAEAKASLLRGIEHAEQGKLKKRDFRDFPD